LVRSKQSSVKIFDDDQNLIFEPLRVVALAKNISKGQVLSQDDFVLIDREETKFHGAFNEIKDVVGRKAKASLASGTVIKARHLETVYLINKEDTVLVIAQNSKLMITTSAIALEEGQLGDMIAIENIKSKKILKAIITGRKKVSPITNM
jgi:flagella basal body P-ring formation protein FlgA